MKKRYKIAMVSNEPITDRRALSGSVFYIQKAILQYAGDVDFIDKLRPRGKALKNILRNFDFSLRYTVARARELFWRLFSKKYFWEMTSIISKYYAKEIAKKTKGKKYDFILADKGSAEIAYLKTDIPIVYMSDATFKLMVDVYPKFSNLSAASVSEGNLLEKKAIRNAAVNIFYSKWAADTAISDYGARNVKVIHSGPYLEPDFIPSYESVAKRQPPVECRLLLIGLDWQRKGCDIAVETVERLNSMGLKSKLTICGSVPPEGKKISPNTEIMPFLDKNKIEDMRKMISLYENAAYFILPTRAECLAVVLLEACSFGLPVLATGTGGIPEMIKDGINGFTFSLQDGADKYAEKIIENFGNKEEYKKMP